jgi:hypothetical protein
LPSAMHTTSSLPLVTQVAQSGLDPHPQRKRTIAQGICFNSVPRWSSSVAVTDKVMPPLPPTSRVHPRLRSRWTPPFTNFHPHQSNSSSSKRTRVAAHAHFVVAAASGGVQQKHASARRNAKKRKITNEILSLSLPTAKRKLRLHASVGTTTCLVVDGGLPGETPLLRPLRFEDTGDNRMWRALSMSRGDLHVLDSTYPHKGISHVIRTFSPSVTPTYAPPPFTRLPRYLSVNLMGMDDVSLSTRLCHLLQQAEAHQKKQFSRGSTRHIFSSSKYV